MTAADPLRHALAQELPATTVLDAAGALRLTEGSAVVILDAWTLGTAEELSRHALAHPVTLVPVRGDGALTVAGPVLRPGARGCLACGEYRRLATIGGRVPWHSPGLRLEGRPSPAFTDAVGVLAASLLDSDGAVVHVVHNGRGTW
ncbi:hypothetical protein GT040_06150, partial [Streptomyces sp. SID2119]|nr:hypothetical protein [Streptomyces sp. SID2119]